MLLPYNVKYDEIMAQTKLQTARLGWERWANWAWKADRTDGALMGWDDVHGSFRIDSNDRLLQVYWRSPRVGGVFIGDALLRKIEVKTWDELTEEDARLDGFPNLWEFMTALIERNPKVRIGMDTRLALLTKEWVVGPHDVVCHHCYKEEAAQGLTLPVGISGEMEDPKLCAICIEGGFR